MPLDFIGGGVGRAVVQHHQPRAANQFDSRIRATEETITFSSLKQGISTLTSGPVSGSMSAGRRLSSPSLWTTDRIARKTSPEHAERDGADEQHCP